MIGRTYLERGHLVVVLARWGPGGGPRNVLIRLPRDYQRAAFVLRSARRPHPAGTRVEPLQGQADGRQDVVSRVTPTDPPTSRIPPGGEDLEFVRNNETGTVHVHRWYTEPFQNGGVDLMADLATVMVQAITGPGPEMLCGEHLKYGWPGSRGDHVSAFPDEAICRRCVRVLGDQAPRAFEHPQSPDEEDI